MTKKASLRSAECHQGADGGHEQRRGVSDGVDHQRHHRQARAQHAGDRIGGGQAHLLSIAAQTNLGAQIATIEAARAGEAAVASAVVANEVRAGAGARDRRSRRRRIIVIAAIGGDMEVRLNKAIANISDMIRRINDMQGNHRHGCFQIRSANLQRDVTHIAKAAAGSTSISSNLDGVAVAAHNTPERRPSCSGKRSDSRTWRKSCNEPVGRGKIGDAVRRCSSSSEIRAGRRH